MKTTSEATSDAPAMPIEQAMARVAELDFTMLKRKLALQKGWGAVLAPAGFFPLQSVRLFAKCQSF